MSFSVSFSALLATLTGAASSTAGLGRKTWRCKCIFTCNPLTLPSHSAHSFLLRVANDSSRTEVSSDINSERSEADKIVDGMEFGELCNEFECKSSPLVESTARQLVRDILELREGNRALGTFAVSVRYKDPVRRFTGREKYLRPLWVTNALDKPSVSAQETVLLSTSELSIKWIIRGQPKSFIAGIGGDLVIRIDSNFTLNRISGQVIEHEESHGICHLHQSLHRHISGRLVDLSPFPRALKTWLMR